MNQNPPPVTPEEQRVIPVEEEVKEEVTVARKGLGRIFAVIERSRIGKSTKAGIKKIAIWLTTKAGLKAVAATVSAGVIPAASLAWKTLKKAGKVALGAFAAIFMWAAHYGPAALAGATAGLLGGALLGIKLGAMTFGALAPVIGPFAAIPAVIVGVGTWVATTFFGAAAGVGVQLLLDKIGAALSGISLPQIGAAGLTEATTAAVSTAKWALPAAATTGIVGGYIVFQVYSAAFVQPPVFPRYVLPPEELPPIITPVCEEDGLISLFCQASQLTCIPPAMLMAVGWIETGGNIWTYTCEEIEIFSSDKWWEQYPELRQRGYCYDNGYGAWGPMQITAGSWQSYMPGYDLMDRCRLDLAILGAARHINARRHSSATRCCDWSEEWVRYAAYRYCGSCGTMLECGLSREDCGCMAGINACCKSACACGEDYCGIVWLRYLEYNNLYPCAVGGGCR